MGLAESQRLLARLYTDASLRARFVNDPQAIGAEFGLSCEEAHQMSGVSVEQVRRFAGSLCEKRRLDVAKLLSLTLRAIGDARFKTLFRTHAATYVPSGRAKIPADAAAFCGFLLSEPRAIESPWMADVVRYERGWLTAVDPQRRWLMVRLRHTLSDLELTLQTRKEPPERPTLVLWLRTTPGGPLRRLSVRLPGGRVSRSEATRSRPRQRAET